MCNLYSTANIRGETDSLFGVAPPNEAWAERIYPDQDAPVIRLDRNGDRTCQLLRWGFPPPPKGRAPVTNVRNLASPFWRPWLKKPYRCLVPFDAFSENDTERQTHWFRVVDRPVAAFAGVWRPWTGERLIKKEAHTRRVREEREWSLFAFLTTEPNDVARPIHEKAMPVILTEPDEWVLWLYEDDQEAAMKLVKPLQAHRLVISE